MTFRVSLKDFIVRGGLRLVGAGSTDHFNSKRNSANGKTERSTSKAEGRFFTLTALHNIAQGARRTATGGRRTATLGYALKLLAG
jgi:hypothetical protein